MEVESGVGPCVGSDVGSDVAVSVGMGAVCQSWLSEGDTVAICVVVSAPEEAVSSTEAWGVWIQPAIRRLSTEAMAVSLIRFFISLIPFNMNSYSI